jgi:hypothetical protein
MKLVLTALACLLIVRAEDMGVLRKMAENKLAPKGL